MTRLRKLAAAAGTVALLAFGPACKHEKPEKARKPVISAMKPETENLQTSKRGSHTCPAYPPENINEIKWIFERAIGKNKSYFWSNGVNPKKKTKAKIQIMVHRTGVVSSIISLKVGGHRFSPSSVGLEQLEGKNLGATSNSACYLMFERVIYPRRELKLPKLIRNIMSK